jgi:hypothetical protein
MTGRPNRDNALTKPAGFAHRRGPTLRAIAALAEMSGLLNSSVRFWTRDENAYNERCARDHAGRALADLRHDPEQDET